jgi:prolyl-tRNA synthetase
VFQIQTKFRNEKRAKAGLLRGREFLMKDLYSFHASQEDLDQYYEQVIGAYTRIFERVGLGDLTYLTFASGGTFAKYSHEFQTISEAGEDLIYVCDKCRLAINKEIISEQSTCPQCGNSDLKEMKASEVGNIFKLGTKYSEPFNLHYQSADGEKKTVIMGCYGIGLSRIMGMIAEICHDDRGLMWPMNVAPFRVHLLSLTQNEQAQKLYDELQQAGIEVLFDERNVSAGEKFADADLIGCPYRLVVSEKSLKAGGVEFKKRQEKDFKIVNINEIISYVK